MKLCELSPNTGSRKRRKRVGRGHGCHVKTSCRGSKGQNSRSGGGKGPGFEGGQTPWYRRLPKYKGFKNFNETIYTEITLNILSRFKEGEQITPEILREKGFIKNLKYPVKVLGKGELKVPLNVRLHKFTKGAIETIKAAGGKVEVI